MYLQEKNFLRALFKKFFSYRVFKRQVDFLKVAQLGTLWTKMNKFFFSYFLKMGNFCQVTIEKDSYSVTTAAWAEMWNRKFAFRHLHNVIYCFIWKVLSFNKSSKWTPFCSIHNFALFLIFISVLFNNFGWISETFSKRTIYHIACGNV